MDLLEARQRGPALHERHPWELARLEVVKGLIARHVPPLAGTAVLDIGCGDTFVVERLAATFPQAWFYAVDTAFTDESMAHYRARLRVRNVIVSSSLDTADPPLDRPASLVLLMDVLEHVADDREFLTDLMAHPGIGAGAHVVVTVPSYQALFCSHDEILGHYRRYSNRQLRHLLEASGLAVLDIGYFFASLIVARAVQVLKERGLNARKDTTGLVTWNGSATLTAVIKRLLLADVHLSSFLRRISITMPGLSNYAICRKPA